MMLVARLLGRETYGQFVIIQSTLGMIGVLAGFGIGTTATRYVADLRSRDSGRLGRIITITERTVMMVSLLIAIALGLGSNSLASTILNSADLAFPLCVSSLSVVFATLDGYQKSVLVGFEAMRRLAIGAVMGGVIGLPVMIALTGAFGLNGAAVGLAATSFSQFAFTRHQMQTVLHEFGISRNERSSISEWRTLRDFALPSLLSGLLVLPAHWVCQALLARTPYGYAELALLGVAMQWFNAAMFLPNLAGRIVLPIMTERLTAGDERQAAAVLRATVFANAVVVVPSAVGISLASPWIMAMYGPEFRDGWPSLVLVSAIAALVVSAMPVGHMLAAKERMWTGVTMNLGWASVYIGVALALVTYGSIGIVISLGVAYLAHTIWVAWFASRNLWIGPCTSK
jgi:O-antigen/teichoic acid export membrane protein